MALRPLDTGRSRILVVEDDVTFGHALRQVLTRAGYDVVLAADFRAALGVLEDERPLALLLVDIVMPNSVNGLALSRMARLRRRNLKVVYVTGYDIPGLEQELLGPVLRKPVENSVLIEQIERTLAA
jgi:CheY-like chemotaxis protein